VYAFLAKSVRCCGPPELGALERTSKIESSTQDLATAKSVPDSYRYKDHLNLNEIKVTIQKEC